jgi:hypothetical protein
MEVSDCIKDDLYNDSGIVFIVAAFFADAIKQFASLAEVQDQVNCMKISTC